MSMFGFSLVVDNSLRMFLWCYIPKDNIIIISEDTTKYLEVGGRGWKVA